MNDNPDVHPTTTGECEKTDFNFSKLPDSWARVPRPTPPSTGFSNRCCPKNARKTVPCVVPRCPDWCHTVFLILSQFPPLLHSWSPGTGRRTRAKTEAHKRKETPSKLGVSEINAAFFNAYRSGETGIRTLGTLAGTPVFKTGAIGRSAISPGRMLRSHGLYVNDPCDALVQFL